MERTMFVRFGVAFLEVLIFKNFNKNGGTMQLFLYIKCARDTF